MAGASPPPSAPISPFFAISFYWFVSISLVFLNKILLSGEASLPAPLFVTWYQTACGVLLCYIFGEIGDAIRREKKEGDEESIFEQFPKFEYDLGTARKVLPASVCFIGMVSFNNLCIQYVDVSMYMIARSLTILFNIALGYVVLGDSTSLKAGACCLIVVVGFALGSMFTAQFSFLGSLFGLCASLFVALYSIFVKKVLPAVGDSKNKLQLYNSVNCAIIFIPLWVVIEGSMLMHEKYRDLLGSPNFWGMMTVSGAFGFLIGLAVYIQIQATSPLSHNVSATAKSAFQSILGVFVFGNTTTAMQVLGLMCVLGGSYAYAVVKRAERAAAKATASASAGNNNRQGCAGDEEMQPLKKTTQV